ncbi:MAG: glucose-6-phosphate isomerase [Dehalococcoidia bacterium]|nr:glucose-6-phosphate isomerase [Dehalococcoidia bacterium]
MTDRYHLGDYSQLVFDAAGQLDADSVPKRLCAHDVTLWSDDPTEIADRLAWLTLPTDVLPRISELRRFAESVQSAGYRNIVLLGMGGSSLGPEVIRQVLGPSLNGASFPRMLTLDSTVPGWVASTTSAIDPAHTLFVLSSKSGTTTEPLAFYAYFRELVNSRLGAEGAGDNFVAVTDPGTPLAEMARTERFRHAFINDPNIGGRYSVLSYFGLAPAALAGVDLERLLEPALRMQQRCLLADSTADNPGAWLGTAIGTLAKQGRDKLTLIASEQMAPFGLWVEQLLAESTGKNGTGVIPVAGEPLDIARNQGCYGDDRFFVQVRLASDDNVHTDEAVLRLRDDGHPVAVLELSDPNDLTAEFYRWEYATAIAGHLMGIQPFDQPDVQGAKDSTVAVLARYQDEKRLARPEFDDPAHLRRLLAQSRSGDYLAIMSYLPASSAVDDAVQGLRQKAMRKYRVATTHGYGPRFLHSTGQLHKGGPDTGIFLQLTQSHSEDIPIPGWPFSFGVLADAQALGDLQALQTLGRRTVSINVGDDPARAISEITEIL